MRLINHGEYVGRFKCCFLRLLKKGFKWYSLGERRRLGDTGWIDPLNENFADYGKIILYEHAFRYKLVANDILKFLNKSETNRTLKILDIGSGTGYGSRILFSLLNRKLKSKGCKLTYTSTDIDEAAIIEGQKYAVSSESFNSSFQVGSIYHLSQQFDENFFDIVIFFEVIEHLDKPSLSMLEVKKILKHGGRLYLSSPNREYPIRMLYNRIHGITSLTNPTHLFEFDWSQFCSFVKKFNDWKIIQLSGENLFPPGIGDRVLNIIPKSVHFAVLMKPSQHLPRCSRNFLAIMEKSG